MKKRKFGIFLAITALLLSLSSCAAPQPADAQGSVASGAVIEEAASADRALAAEYQTAGMRASGQETGEESRGAGGMAGPENEADPGQGNVDTIHETGQSIRSDTGRQVEGNVEPGSNRQPAGGNAEPGSNQQPAGGNAEPGSNRQPAEGNAEPGSNLQPAGSNAETPEVTEELEIHFLDVGQGDCTLLLCGGEAMLIDAGDNDQGTRIQNYLRKQNVETLKYVVCTHPDEDHIGGMDVILYKFNCETILMTEEDKDTNTYRDVVDTMKNRGYERTLPVVGQQYSLGDADFTILAPSSLGDDSNNNSIALLLTHGSNRILFTGDAEEEEEAEMLDSGILVDVDVYKAGHHGSRTSSSEKLLEAVSPEYAVISCGEGNSYGHPHAETMNAFRALGIQVFRTDEQGSIVLASDGSEILWNCSPSDTWLAGEPTGSAEAKPQGERQSEGMAGAFSGIASAMEPDGTAYQEGAAAEAAVTAPAGKEPTVEPAVTVSPEEESPEEAVSYICNTNTKKFHYPECSSVKQMKEKNKLPTSATREELIGQGYDPCKKCNP